MALFAAAAPHRRHRKAKLLLLCALVILVEVSRVQSRHHHKHGNIQKLLAAGLIAKALAQGGEEGGEGGGGHHGHHYMPIPVPVHGRDNGHHSHHVHHKYVPIPVKHHTNFIIAHHKVPVHVHVPVPVVKTKVVHVPVEKTKIVPIIVHKGHHHHPHHHHFDHAGSVLHPKKYRSKGSISAFSPQHIALASNNGKKAVRITSLGTLRHIKGAASNATSVKLERSKGVPDKWIVVVKSKRRRPSSLRRRTVDLSKLMTSAASAPSPLAVKPPPLSR